MVIKFNHEPATNFDKVITEIGNGNYDSGLALLNSIAMRLFHARTKHPVNGADIYESLEAIRSEFYELEYAANHESPERRYDEALDVIATVIRFMNREYKK